MLCRGQFVRNGGIPTNSAGPYPHPAHGNIFFSLMRLRLPEDCSENRFVEIVLQKKKKC